MNDSVQIKYAKVKTAADLIKDDRNKIQAILDDFTLEMNKATNEAAFQGNAANEVKEKFYTLKKKFDEYVALLDDFSGMISFAEQQTQATEQQITRAAQDIL